MRTVLAAAAARAAAGPRAGSGPGRRPRWSSTACASRPARPPRQVVTVNHTAGHRARVTYWRLVAGEWVARMRTADGRTGYGGLVAGDRRVQGTGTTPLGTYGLLSVFGTHPRRDAGALDYRRIRRGDYWVQDNASPHYNRYRNQRQGGFRWWLPSSRPQRVRAADRLPPASTSGRSSPASTSSRCGTAGRGSSCTSTAAARRPAACRAPRRFLRALVRRLDPAAAPVIAIGR